LFLRQRRDVLFKSNIAKTSVKIIVDHFRALDGDYILATLYKDMYVAKIDILFSVLDCRDDNDNLIVIMRIKEFYFCSVSPIRIIAFRNSCVRLHDRVIKVTLPRRTLCV